MNDDRLRDAFHALRREDATQAPLYSATVQRAVRARRARPALALPAFGALVATILAVSVFAVHRAEERRRAHAALFAEVHTAVLSGRWTSPTDFLLETPGDDLLRSMPSPESPEDLLRFLGPRPLPQGGTTL